MKKLTLILVIMVAFGFVACKGGDGKTGEDKKVDDKKVEDKKVVDKKVVDKKVADKKVADKKATGPKKLVARIARKDAKSATVFTGMKGGAKYVCRYGRSPNTLNSYATGKTDSVTFPMKDRYYKGKMQKYYFAVTVFDKNNKVIGISGISSL